MSDVKGGAFKASTGGKIYAGNSKTYGYETVAIAETGGYINLEGGTHFNTSALKIIDSTAEIVKNSPELQQTEKESIISLLSSLKEQSKEGFTQICERILSIASSATTLLPILAICFERLQEAFP